MKLADYESVSQSTTREEFRQALADCATKLGFPLVNALLVDGKLGSPDLRIGAIGNTPASFLVTHADLARIKTDPVMRRLQDDRTPFFWDQRFYASRGMGHLWEDQAPFGYRYGVAASLLVSEDQHVFVGVDRHEKLPGSGLQLARLQADLQLLAMHTHVAARRLLQRPAPKGLASLQLPHLSPREVDVLRWTDNGKTVIEIAMILGVGERTVKSYIDIAKEKLGVVGKKEQAVKVAKALGLI